MNLQQTLIALISVSAFYFLDPQLATCQVRQKVATRIFWQDRDTDQLSYADLVTTNRWSIKRGWVNGFPKLDFATQDLSQMQVIGNMLLVGIKDTDNGKNQSGWVAIDTGAYEEPHGNHTHWKYNRIPAVRKTMLDKDQGNPNRAYVYDRNFYITNDQKNGFTKIDPLGVANGQTNSHRFHVGGGNKMGLAAINNSVAYSSWADPDGPNAGRVDVVNLRQFPSKIQYSLQVQGAIHDATVNSNRVFLATDAGAYWLQADTTLSGSTESAKINALPAATGQQSDASLKISTFENSRNWVLFATGVGKQSALCMMNAQSPQPSVVKLPIDVAEGLKLMPPKSVLSLGRRYAFLFQDRIDAESNVQEQLTIVELDPNRDRDFSDAKIKLTLPVGASKVSGRYGHHSIAFDAYGRTAVFTEPGEGIVNVMSLPAMQVVARFRVGGTPDNIAAIGAPEHFH